MLVVTLPPGFAAERAYVVETVCRDFLGVECELHHGGAPGLYVLSTGGKNRIEIEDHFFGRLDETRGYLDPALIPDAVSRAALPFAPERETPILFGLPVVTENGGSIRCGVDLFAGIFFMLSRWEEHARRDRDRHGRFPASASLASRQGFLHRPLVNEYVEMLRCMLNRCGHAASGAERRHRLLLTHDIDNLWKWGDRASLFRTLAGDLLKRRSPGAARAHWRSFPRIAAARTVAAAALSWIMERSEAIGARSRFYFSATRRIDPDPGYSATSQPVKALMAMVRERGHVLGFHAGYYTYDNPALWHAEKHRLENAAGVPLLEGRQHYLRFSVPGTWQLWEANGMETDSTLGFPEEEGFRCGTGDPFSVFDVVQRRPLRLRELPLVIMDATLREYRGLDLAASEATIQRYIRLAARYRMTLTLLLHNHIFHEGEADAPGWRGILERLA